MTIKRPSDNGGIWAETGTKAAIPGDISPTKAAAGWVSGASADRPYIEFFNFLQNRVDVAVEKILTERVTSPCEDSADIYKGIVSGVWDEPWGMTDDTLNITGTSSAADAYVDICSYYNSDGDPRILILEAAAPEIQVWNPRTNTVVRTTNALTDDLPSGGSEVWTPVKMVCDNTNVYVVFTDSNPAPDEHHIQAWVIDESSSDWVQPGTWPATGTALTGTGNGPVSNIKDLNIVIADDDYLVVGNGGVAAAAVGSAVLELISRTTGLSADTGCGLAASGGCTLGGTYYFSGGLCSDGTSIYATATDIITGVDDTILFTAEIADLETSNGGTGYPYTMPNSSGGDIQGRCLCSLGVGRPFVSMHNESPAPAGTATPFIVHTAAEAALMLIELGDLASGEEGEDFIFNEGLGLTFDGLNLWILGFNIGAGSDQLRLIKIDTAKLYTIAADDNLWLKDLTNSIFTILPAEEFAAKAASGRKDVTLCFDGRDIWVNPEPRVTQTRSGEIVRLPLALLRH